LVPKCYYVGMKLRYIAGISLALTTVATAGILYATPKPEPHIKSVNISSIKHQAAIKPSEPVAVTAPKPVIETPKSPTPVSNAEANKAKLHASIDAISEARGISKEQTGNRPSLFDTQWICIDKIVSYRVGYDDYETAESTEVVQAFKQPFNSSDGHTVGYRYFDGPGSCTLKTNPKY